MEKQAYIQCLKARETDSNHLVTRARMALEDLQPRLTQQRRSWPCRWGSPPGEV